jgi:aminoglycoside phosphotransferase (APT) family kinase protein
VPAVVSVGDIQQVHAAAMCPGRTVTAQPGTTDADAAVRVACDRVGLNTSELTCLRSGENTLYRLPDGVIVRVARPGQLHAAAKEVRVARWLAAVGLPAVRVLSGIEQPVEVDGRAVTFWLELPPHRPGTPTQVATALRRLHSLPAPAEFGLPRLEPFVRLRDRITGATTFTEHDRTWMLQHLADLARRYADLPAGRPGCVVHGDAWRGNIVSTVDGQVVVLDLERVAIGPPEWDLVHTVIKHSSFGWISAADSRNFVDTYGYDVTEWAGFELLRDIREFRMTCTAAQAAAENPALHGQAAHRLACTRGQLGPRPWPGWHPMP